MNRCVQRSGVSIKEILLPPSLSVMGFIAITLPKGKINFVEGAAKNRNKR